MYANSGWYGVLSSRQPWLHHDGCGFFETKEKGCGSLAALQDRSELLQMPRRLGAASNCDYHLGYALSAAQPFSEIVNINQLQLRGSRGR
ncbi:hypothetical protein NDU88_006392 [Pleurodeles waltl]|uniref:Uncharacterized protein n=1 Tax=Pleurodeles waltl TaxID=8319 RepID=A0AAV7RRW5_PLEWA|nr:hypothetical protein NDU88_006392 [Pleurodeles waltl]